MTTTARSVPVGEGAAGAAQEAPHAGPAPAAEVLLGGLRHPGALEFLRLAEHGDAVARPRRVVAAGADDQLAAGGDDPDRDEVAEQRPQRPLLGDADLGGDEVLLAEQHVVVAAAHAGVDHRRREQAGHVQSAAVAGRLFHRPPDRRVVEVGDHGDVLAQVAHQQRRLDVAQIARLGADDRPRPGQPGRAQQRLGVVVAGHIGTAPARHQALHARIAVVVEHHDRHPGRPQLLHRAQPDALEATDDHVTCPVPALGRLYVSWGGEAGHLISAVGALTSG